MNTKAQADNQETVITVMPTKQWREFSPDQYKAASGQMVTFSLKTVNSNAAATGIRLSMDQAMKAPYVSARTLLGAGQSVDVDYIKSVGPIATIAKQIDWSLSEDVPEGVNANITRQIAEVHKEVTGTHCEIATDAIGARARQLLLPCEDGSYIAVTPITPGGVCKRIKQATQSHNETVRETAKQTTKEQDSAKSTKPMSLNRIHQAQFGIGGANPQNVGRLTRDMQSPLVFLAPREDKAIKKLLSWYYRGAPIQPPNKPLEDYYQWRQANRVDDPPARNTMRKRNEEAARIRQIAYAVLLRAHDMHEQMMEQRDILPNRGEPLVSPNAPSINRALLDPGERTSDWFRAFSRRLARTIADYKPSHSIDAQFIQTEMDALATVVEGAMR